TLSIACTVVTISVLGVEIGRTCTGQSADDRTLLTAGPSTNADTDERTARNFCRTAILRVISPPLRAPSAGCIEQSRARADRCALSAADQRSGRGTTGHNSDIGRQARILFLFAARLPKCLRHGHRRDKCEDDREYC